MPWGAIVGAAVARGALYGSSSDPSALQNSLPHTFTRARRNGVRRRAERMARKRMLASAKPWLITLGIVIGLWAGYHAMLWVLWWNPHPIQQTPFYYG